MSLHTSHRMLVAVAVIGFVSLTFLIAIIPALDMQDAARRAVANPFTAEELRGRELYLIEGCNFCHTQFVRALDVDKPYGRGSVAEDYILEDPPLMGTQRTGPDLSNVGVRQPSDAWNLIHLYNPRAVVPHSAMPGYPWYFEEKEEASPNDKVVPIPEPFAPNNKVVIATDDAVAMVSYLLALKQAKIQ